MTKELAKRTPVKTCRYQKGCGRIARLAAVLSAAAYCAFIPTTIVWTPYLLCVAASMWIFTVTLIPGKRGPTVRCVPLMLKTCYYAVSTNILFARGDFFGVSRIPTLLSWAARDVTALAALLSAYAFLMEGSTKAGYKHWRIFKKTLFAGCLSDFILAWCSVCSLNFDLPATTGPLELPGRMAGEIFFSIAVLFAVRPGFVTINLIKVRRLARQCVLIILLAVLYHGGCSLIFHQPVSLSHTIIFSEMISCQLVLLIQMLRRFVVDFKRSGASRRNYFKEYCQDRWCYSLADIAVLSRLLTRLAEIRKKIKECSASGRYDAYLSRLQNSELSLILKLQTKYGIDVPLDEDGIC